MEEEHRQEIKTFLSNRFKTDSGWGILLPAGTGGDEPSILEPNRSDTLDRHCN